MRNCEPVPFGLGLILLKAPARESSKGRWRLLPFLVFNRMLKILLRWDKDTAETSSGSSRTSSSTATLRWLRTYISWWLTLYFWIFYQPIWTYLLLSKCCISGSWTSAVQGPWHYIALFSQFGSQKLVEKGPSLPTGTLSYCLWRLQTSVFRWSVKGMEGKAQAGPKGRKPEIQNSLLVPCSYPAILWQRTDPEPAGRLGQGFPHQKNTSQRAVNLSTKGFGSQL